MPVIDAAVVALLNVIQATISGIVTITGQIGAALTQILTFLYQFANDVKSLLNDGFAGSWDWFKAIYSGVEGIYKGLDPITRGLITIVPLLTTLTAAFQDPEGAINSFMCMVIDIIVGHWWPVTPQEYQIGFVLNNIITTFPVGSYFLVQTMEGVVGILGIFLFFKVLKLLPFF